MDGDEVITRQSLLDKPLLSLPEMFVKRDLHVSSRKSSMLPGDVWDKEGLIPQGLIQK